MKDKDINKKEKTVETYENATGPIEYTLKSDLVFHYIMQKSEAALKGLVCSLKGITADSVKSIVSGK